MGRGRKGQGAWNAACSFERTEGVGRPGGEGRPLRPGEACPPRGESEWKVDRLPQELGTCSYKIGRPFNVASLTKKNSLALQYGLN